MILARRFSTPGKRGVRERWNTPILRFLHDEYGLRYRYMGLPGVDALDIQLWQDMIDEVIAFEVRSSPTRDDPDGRAGILRLRNRLARMRIPNRSYFGAMEVVVRLRQDLDGLEYWQDKVITLYNLDFCDEISSPVPVPSGGQEELRFEAIRHILRDQRRCYDAAGEPCYFVLLLTCRDQMNAVKLCTFLSEVRYEDAVRYRQACGGVESLPQSGRVVGQASWALKLFIHEKLRQYMENPNISAVFLPMVRYTGTPVGGTVESPMLHFMAFCRFEEDRRPSPTFLPTDYLNTVPSAWVVDENNIVWRLLAGEPGEPARFADSRAWLCTEGRSFLDKLREEFTSAV